MATLHGMTAYYILQGKATMCHRQRLCTSLQPRQTVLKGIQPNGWPDMQEASAQGHSAIEAAGSTGTELVEMLQMHIKDAMLMMTTKAVGDLVAETQRPRQQNQKCCNQ